MPRATFDRTTGWWSIKIRLADGTRKKYQLMKHPGYKPGKITKTPREPLELPALVQIYVAKALAARHGANVEDIRPMTVPEFLAEYQSDYAQDHTDNSVRMLRTASGHFLDFCKAHHIESILAVTRDVAEKYMRWRLGKGKSRATVHTERGILAAAWNKAVISKRLTENPWRLLRTPGRATDGKTEFWSKSELHQLILASDGWVRYLIIIAANTGGRMGGILKLRWKDVDLGRKTVRYHIKTKPYTVPLNPAAVEAFESRAAESKTDLVFQPTRGATLRRTATAYKAIREAVKRAGIPDKLSYNHILRHTFASHAVMDGVPLVTVSKWLGHTTVHMTLRYSHLAESESQRQMQSFSLSVAPSPTSKDPGD